MSNHFNCVTEFHKAFDAPHPDKPTLYPLATLEENKKLHKLRYDLIAEELEELRVALENDNIVEVADAIADLDYVVTGAAVSYGLPIDKLFDEVHRSNMSKLGEDGKPVRRQDGKVLKGPLYSPPDLKPIIDQYHNE